MNLLFRSPFFLPWIYPSLLWRVDTKANELFLTFDDGPVAGPTEFVLDTLGKYNIKATFFCIGENIERHPDIFSRIKADKHGVGNHTFNHIKGWNCTTEEYVSNVNRCSPFFDSRDNLFRPPYGRITQAQINALRNHKIVMWDVLTQDYDQHLSEEKCLRGSIRATRPGSIVVFHDSVKAERNMRYTLPRYIDYFLNQGFSFKTIPVD
jgi:peptidoglycan/xylan/chitin deacetylase (PgdA/CDA1 family)